MFTVYAGPALAQMNPQAPPEGTPLESGVQLDPQMIELVAQGMILVGREGPQGEVTEMLSPQQIQQEMGGQQVCRLDNLLCLRGDNDKKSMYNLQSRVSRYQGILASG